jgi:hypothetical protein
MTDTDLIPFNKIVAWSGKGDATAVMSFDLKSGAARGIV